MNNRERAKKQITVEGLNKMKFLAGIISEEVDASKFLGDHHDMEAKENLLSKINQYDPNVRIENLASMSVVEIQQYLDTLVSGAKEMQSEGVDLTEKELVINKILTLTNNTKKTIKESLDQFDVVDLKKYLVKLES